MSRKWRPTRDFKSRDGRLVGSFQPSNFNLPRFNVTTEGFPDKEGFICTISFSYGNGYSDPVLFLDLDVTRWRIAKPISTWWWKREGRRHDREQ